MSSRLTKQGWVEIGLAQLRAVGPSGLTLEAMTAAAGRTKGSFYHHFADHAEFLRELARHWLENWTLRPIEELREFDSVRDVRRELATYASQLDQELERQFRGLAEGSDVVRDAIHKSDTARIAFLTQMQMANGLEEQEALDRASIQHAFFVGTQYVFPRESSSFRLRLDRILASKLWSEPGPKT